MPLSIIYSENDDDDDDLIPYSCRRNGGVITAALTISPMLYHRLLRAMYNDKLRFQSRGVMNQ